MESSIQSLRWFRTAVFGIQAPIVTESERILANVSGAFDRAITKIDAIATGEGTKNLVDKYDAFFLDCDGTLYHESALLPGIKETLNKLKAQNN